MNNKLGTTHEKAIKLLGQDEYSLLLLSERAFNQRHWSKKIRAVILQGNPWTPADKLRKIVEIIDAMDSEADKYAGKELL